jgi:hypothetical protein
MYSEIIAGLPDNEIRDSWTSEQLATVWTLEDIIREYSYGERSIDSDFYYLSLFTNKSGQFSLTSTDYTIF